MAVYSITTQSGDTAPSGGQEDHSLSEEPHPGFESDIEQQLIKADVLTTEEQREALRRLFRKFYPIVSKDSNDCGGH